MTHIITPDMLLELNVCDDEFNIFITQWPEGAEVTVENVLTAFDLYLDVYWFAEAFFPETILREFDWAVEEAGDKYWDDGLSKDFFRVVAAAFVLAYNSTILGETE